jgi:hypothetical protein
MMMKRNILVVYACAVSPLRATTWEHLYAFRHYSADNVYYLNLAFKRVPWYVRALTFDLIIFHTLFLSNHWGGAAHFGKLLNKAKALKRSKAVKIMLPQDEFFYSNLYCDLINEFGIDYVFSVAPETEWPKIYHAVDFRRVKFRQVLAGYLDDRKLDWIVALGQSDQDRPIDIGYRTAGKPYFWFGRHGFLKQQVADVFQAKAPGRGLSIDISTHNKDTILGDEWYRFLARCKYTLGVESGTSLLDLDGSIHEKTQAYLALHPEADFAEVEAACFPNLDGTSQLYAISSRHLEACATRTCQVLTAGDYNGILHPGWHYIELKKDFSNIDEVLDIMARDDVRPTIVEQAYREVIASGQYTYKHFVAFVTEQSLGNATPQASTPWGLAWHRAMYVWMQWVETVEWLWIKLVYAPLIAPSMLKARAMAKAHLINRLPGFLVKALLERKYG